MQSRVYFNRFIAAGAAIERASPSPASPGSIPFSSTATAEIDADAACGRCRPRLSDGAYQALSGSLGAVAAHGAGDGLGTVGHVGLEGAFERIR